MERITVMTTAYELAKEAYAQYGIDTEAVIEKLAAKPVSMHCWQGDDVMGFDQKDNAASGGIMTTGNYPGRARTFEELTADFEKAASLIPGWAWTAASSWEQPGNSSSADSREASSSARRASGAWC